MPHLETVLNSCQRLLNYIAKWTRGLSTTSANTPSTLQLSMQVADELIQVPCEVDLCVKLLSHSDAPPWPVAKCVRTHQLPMAVDRRPNYQWPPTTTYNQPPSDQIMNLKGTYLHIHAFIVILLYHYQRYHGQISIKHWYSFLKAGPSGRAV